MGETLGVRTVLEGSVRRAGNRLRITAQLVDVANDSHLWSERFDRELADVFEIQDEIAAAIVEQLHVTLCAPPAVRRATTNVQAYEALQEGDITGTRSRPKDSAKALACSELALSLGS